MVGEIAVIANLTAQSCSLHRNFGAFFIAPSEMLTQRKDARERIPRTPSTILICKGFTSYLAGHLVSASAVRDLTEIRSRRNYSGGSFL
jgi:hypothetical protein